MTKLFKCLGSIGDAIYYFIVNRGFQIHSATQVGEGFHIFKPVPIDSNWSVRTHGGCLIPLIFLEE